MAFLLVGGEMSLANELFKGFPLQIPAGASNDAVYEQKPGYFALHGGLLPRDKAVAVFEPEGIAILQGSPSASLGPGQTISPVYAAKDGTGLAAPTGQIFIRFREGECVAAHRATLEREGFRIAEVPDYAPQAAWLRPLSGSIADALGAFSRLSALPGVESVEVQLLMQSARR